MSRLTSFVTATLLAGAATLGGGAPAHAEEVGLACTGTQTAHYRPPLGPLSQDTTVQARPS